MTEPVARCKSVMFKYFRRPVFNDLSVSVRGGITCLLGPNGAGKSTLMSLMATQRAPGSGLVEVLGRDARRAAQREEIRARVGVLAQSYPLVGSMSVVTTVAYAGWAQGLSRARAYRQAEATLEALNLAGIAGRRIRTLSGGQRQRVGLATSMVHEPEFLILDEPSAGLDPEARVGLRRVLLGAAQRCSVLLSTHLVDDVVAVSDAIIVLDQGQVLFCGGARELEAFSQRIPADVPGTALERGYIAMLEEGRARASG